MKRPRIVYLMHVDWRWIKQRPHILAEGLAESFDVLVVHRTYLQLGATNPTPVARTGLIPWLDRGGVFWQQTDASLNKMRVSRILQKFSPDVIWLCFPSLLAYIPKWAKAIPIVYDCMDLDVGFYSHPQDQAYIAAIGDQAIRQAALVLCSSQYLEQNVKQRCPDAKTLLVRNGVQQRWLQSNPRADTPAKRPVRLGYFGTIAPWFDWDLMLAALEQFPDLEIDLIGPNHGKLVRHPRIQYHGTVAHDQLRQKVAHMDGFVMPFVLSELVLGVDPVKLYEYLSLGREVFAVAYPEVERFSPYVHLYTSKAHFLQLLEAWQTGKLKHKNLPEITSKFLQDNTWQVRIEQVGAQLRGLLDSDTSS